MGSRTYDWGVASSGAPFAAPRQASQSAHVSDRLGEETSILASEARLVAMTYPDLERQVICGRVDGWHSLTIERYSLRRTPTVVVLMPNGATRPHSSRPVSALGPATRDVPTLRRRLPRSGRSGSKLADRDELETTAADAIDNRAKRVDGLAPIASTVVQQDHRSRTNLVQHPTRDNVCARHGPVERLDVPEHDTEVQFAHPAGYPIVARAVGRSEQPRGPGAHCLSDALAGPLNLLVELPTAELREKGVGPCVVAQLVTVRGDPRDHVGIRTHVQPHAEERRTHLFPLERIQDMVGVRGERAIVKGDRHAVHARVPRRDASSGSCQRLHRRPALHDSGLKGVLAAGLSAAIACQARQSTEIVPRRHHEIVRLDRPEARTGWQNLRVGSPHAQPGGHHSPVQHAVGALDNDDHVGAEGREKTNHCLRVTQTESSPLDRVSTNGDVVAIAPPRHTADDRRRPRGQTRHSSILYRGGTVSPADESSSAALPGEKAASHLNIGILAHVDAGKTSLTERILFEAGVLAAPGSVDAGTTATDSMDIERRRGITIRSAVTSFRRDELGVNIIDTPGHPDFIAEVERALGVLDGAILVLSALEGVQAQTLILWRVLQRMKIPTVIFINKVDLTHARPRAAFDEVRTRLSARVLPLTKVTRGAESNLQSVPWSDGTIIESLAEVCPITLNEWATGVPTETGALLTRIRHHVARAEITPVLAGSALTGSGVAELLDAATRLLPRTQPDLNGSPKGLVFKIDRDHHGKRVFVRMLGGSLSTRELVELRGRPKSRITGVQVAADGAFVDCKRVFSGQIAVLRGLDLARVGDTIGDYETHAPDFAPPTMEAIVEAVHESDRMVMYGALSELAEQDPLISLRINGARNEIAISLFGEVQKEVIADLLDEWHGIEVRFRESTTICVERVVGAGAHVERVHENGNPYLGTIGLRIEPGEIGSGVAFALEVERGSMPAAFFSATEEGVRKALKQGLSGWSVTDCVVTVTESGYLARQSHAHQKFSKSFSSVAADFRYLGQLVVARALARAGTVVCEPVDRLDLEVPTASLGAILGLIGQVGGSIDQTDLAGPATRLRGLLRTSEVRGLAIRLPDVTNGEGVLIHEFDHYEAVRGDPPTRERVGPDPSDRDEWFREMPR